MNIKNEIEKYFTKDEIKYEKDFFGISMKTDNNLKNVCSSFKIKEKLEFIATDKEFKTEGYKKYVSSLWMKKTLYISASIIIISKILDFNYTNLFTQSESLLDSSLSAVILFAIVTSASIIGIIFLEYIENKESIFSLYKKRSLIEKELIEEFGSVSRVIFLYNKIKEVGLEITDENIRSCNQEDFSTENNHKLQKIEKKMNSLEKYKKEILLKESEKIFKIINKKRAKKEKEKNKFYLKNPISDISIPVPEFKKVRS